MATSNAVPGFLPSASGLRFANRWPPGPTIRFGPLDPRWIGLGDASAGLCGGMAWFARDRFEAGLPVPPDTEPPANGSPLFRAILRRQVRSLDWLRTPLRFWWMATLGADRAAARTREREWPRIRASIDAGLPAVVGLVRHRGADPRRLTLDHQVLGYAYEVADDGAVAIRVYDPNRPGDNGIAIEVASTGTQGALRQSSGEPLVGLLSLG